MGPKAPIWKSLEWKIVVAVVIIVSIFGVLIFRKINGKPQGTTVTKKAIPQSKPGRKAGRLPIAPESGASSRPFNPMESGTGYLPSEDSQMSGRTYTAPIPEGTSANTETNALPHSAPVTEVHPLSEATEVMGLPSGETDAVGVTRTYQLPGSNSGNANKRAVERPTDTPPRNMPDDAGQTRSFPLPNEPEQP